MRKLFSILSLAILVGAGYFILAQYTNVAYGKASLIPNEQNEVGANGAQVLSWLSQLKSIDLDGKVFNNPKFSSLQDRSVSIAPQEIGRSNPYLPTYGVALSGTSTPKVSLPRASQ